MQISHDYALDCSVFIISYPKSSILSAKFWDILIMALKATIYKADLNIANMDYHIYGDYQLTLALHPSETLERLMVRLMAFARFASDELEFTKDLLKLTSQRYGKKI